MHQLAYRTYWKCNLQPNNEICMLIENCTNRKLQLWNLWLASVFKGTKWYMFLFLLQSCNACCNVIKADTFHVLLVFITGHQYLCSFKGSQWQMSRLSVCLYLFCIKTWRLINMKHSNVGDPFPLMSFISKHMEEILDFIM